MLHNTGGRPVEEERLTTQQWAVLGALSREKSQGGTSLAMVRRQLDHASGQIERARSAHR